MNIVKLNKKFMCFIFAILFFSFCFNPMVVLAEDNINKQSGTSVKPVFVDLGNIKN